VLSVGSGVVGCEEDGVEIERSVGGEDFELMVVGPGAYKHLSMLNAHRRHIGRVSSH
jgi:hypothetical protein